MSIDLERMESIAEFLGTVSKVAPPLIQAGFAVAELIEHAWSTAHSAVVDQRKITNDERQQQADIIAKLLEAYRAARPAQVVDQNPTTE